MKITDKSGERLVVKDSQRTNILLSIIFMLIGGLPTIGILFSGESLIGAIVPFIIFILGLYLMIYRRHPYLLIFDRMSGEVIHKTPKSGRNNYVEERFLLKDVESVEMNMGDYNSTGTYGIKINLKGKNEPFPVLRNITFGKKRVQKIIDEINDFLSNERDIQ